MSGGPGAPPGSGSLLAERLESQGLSGPPAGGARLVTERLLAVQAQDARGFRLAIRARSQGFGADAVDRALTEERSLLVTWLNRGTLQLVCAEDYPWLQALTTPPLWTGNARRLAQEGVGPDAAERGAAVIVRALADDGPLTRAQLGVRLQAAGVPTAGQALVHLLLLASLRGEIVRGPVAGGEQAFVRVRDWLGTPVRPPDRDGALAELARRYLRGHAPAGDRDLARWAGLPLRDARAGLAAIAGELAERGDGLLALRRGPNAAAGERSGARARAAIPPLPAPRLLPPLPAPRLLGAFDPVLLGWRSREFLAGAHAVVLVRNGIFRPFALVAGRAAATWSLPGGRVVLAPLEEIGAADRAVLAADGEAVRRYLGLTRDDGISTGP